MPEETTLDQAERYVGTIRSMIQDENTLLNQRLSWMWALQGLLLGAAGFAWSKEAGLIVVIGSVGILACISIGYSIARGMTAIRELLGLASAYKNRLPSGAAEQLAPTIGARSPATQWLLPAYCMPVVFGCAWVALIGCRFVW